MNNQTDNRELIAKLDELYESCLIREEAQKTLKKGWLEYASTKYQILGIDALRRKGDRRDYAETYEETKPQPKPVTVDNTDKIRVTTEIEKERKDIILNLERPHYKKWMIAAVAVTVLCFLLTAVLALTSYNSLAVIAIPFYGIATAAAIASYVFLDPRSSRSTKKEAGFAPALPLIALGFCAFLLLQFRLFPMLAIAIGNLILNVLMMKRPTQIVKNALQKNPKNNNPYDPDKYVPSVALQKKRAEAGKPPKKEAYQDELAAYDRAFQAKLQQFDREIAQLEKQKDAEEKAAKDKHAAAHERARQQVAETDLVLRQADFLRDEDKTADCVKYIRDALAEGRCATLKQALNDYDDYRAEREASRARMESIEILAAQTIAENKREKEEEERLRQMRIDNYRTQEQLREQQRKIERERKNK